MPGVDLQRPLSMDVGITVDASMGTAVIDPDIHAFAASALFSAAEFFESNLFLEKESLDDLTVNTASSLNRLTDEIISAASVHIDTICFGDLCQSIGKIDPERNIEIANLDAPFFLKPLEGTFHLDVSGIDKTDIAAMGISLKGCSQPLESAKMMGFIGDIGKEDGIVSPVELIWSVSTGKGFKIRHSLFGGDEMGLEHLGKPGDGVVKIEVVAPFVQLRKKGHERGIVFRPETETCHIFRSEGDPKFAMIEGVEISGSACLNPSQKPLTVKCRNVSTPGDRNDLGRR